MLSVVIASWGYAAVASTANITTEPVNRPIPRRPLRPRSHQRYPASRTAWVHFSAHPTRLQQAFDKLACAVLRISTKLLLVTLTHLGDGHPRGHTLLDRIEGPDIVGLALRRHDILIASEAFLEADRVEINAETICVDILAAACAQYGRRAFKIHRLRQRRRGNREKE